MSSIAQEMRKKVYEANMALPKHDLIKFTWGNVSEIDRERNIVAIKPSGVSYETLSVDDIVVVSLDGDILEGNLRPSSDTPTHLELYRCFRDIGGIVHTHSPWATSWAQAGKDIPCYGTTHGDYFYGTIPCTRTLQKDEVESHYELQTGKVIVETFEQKKLRPLEMPGVLVKNHGPFTWGTDAADAVHNAVVLEELACMAFRTVQLYQDVSSVPQYILEKHYQRKHGKNAYYGQHTE